MKQLSTKRLQLYAGRCNPELAVEIAEHLGVRLGNPNITEFANGEIKCAFAESVRGADVFIINTHGPPVNDSIMEQLIMIDAARRASAKRITAVAPFYGYARQDRKASGREPITAKLVANLFKVAGADRIVSVDLHAGQIQGFFDGPVDHLTAMPVLVEWLSHNAPDDIVVVSPDSGRLKVAERYGKHLHCEVASVYKRRSRDRANAVDVLGIMGEVAGRTCVIVDDMIDTAGTICAAAEQLMDAGAADVWAAATHGLFSDPAIDRLKNAPISRIAVTNTLPLPADKHLDKIEVLSIAPRIARAIDAVFEDLSVSEIFDGENQY